MAVLDSARNEIVIRVVYDGPPEAGKTTSMRALAASFGQTSETPEEDATGRTQWFDWMEYVGGRFEGSQIRCQIVSVPGQRELDHRRARLLASADVIVVVGDTSPERWPVTLAHVCALHGSRPDDAVPIGVVFQANKRDVAGAIPLPAVRTELGAARWEVGVIESVAADGTGIRETFVYAVRLALDRVRELIAQGRMETAVPAEQSAEELLASMRKAEPRALAADGPDGLNEPRATAAALLREVLSAETLPAIPPPPRAALAAPHPPDASVPSGAIWPPVEGRAILLEVSGLGLTPRRHGNGDWSAGLGSGWRLVSKKEALFDTLDAGRSALVQWARLHAACTSVVSPHRCIVLAATGDGRWRLWQIVRAEESLRGFVEKANASDEPEAVANLLYLTAHLLSEVHERLADAPVELACSLDTIGACEASGMYIGLMPEQQTAAPNQRVPTWALLEAELGPVLALDLAERKPELERVLAERDANSVHGDPLLHSLQRLLGE